MARSARSLLGGVMGALVLALGTLAFVSSAVRAATLDRDAALRISQSAVGRVPADATFAAADGRTVRLSELRGKPLVVSFVYTGCFQVCPATTQFLALAVERGSDALGAQAFNVATIGFNLPFDTPAAMRDFARRQRIARDNWLFLSPRVEGLERLLQDFGFAYAETPAGFDHVLQATVLDAEGRIVKQVYGESFSLEALVEPLKSLVTGTPVATDSLSSLVERVRVLCTVYDPVSGQYRLDYALFAEMLGGFLVIAGTAIFLLRDRRNAPRRG